MDKSYSNCCNMEFLHECCSERKLSSVAAVKPPNITIAFRYCESGFSMPHGVVHAQDLLNSIEN